LFLPKGILGLYGSWKTKLADRAARKKDSAPPPVAAENVHLPEPQAAE
jgi:urea transport system permease protein